MWPGRRGGHSSERVIKRELILGKNHYQIMHGKTQSPIFFCRTKTLRFGLVSEIKFYAVYGDTGEILNEKGATKG